MFQEQEQESLDFLKYRDVLMVYAGVVCLTNGTWASEMDLVALSHARCLNLTITRINSPNSILVNAYEGQPMSHLYFEDNHYQIVKQGPQNF